MARSGFALMDVMIFGRWASLSSFKLYISKGDVILTRLPQDFSDARWDAVERLAWLVLVVLGDFLCGVLLAGAGHRGRLFGPEDLHR